ncbi:sensor histidine kinase [Streptomyces barringtoniae]|uniref:sensor histidine kinase n=1 Tax=Streptomyces barringtoniae TaxID=2892029 RepID=UPI001E3EB63E|nr:sensor histidine kinase [Streptomyces barringtoniae]MCC5474690.1 sensor histidine kinase [Streptomyces barringtoniae]
MTITDDPAALASFAARRSRRKGPTAVTRATVTAWAGGVLYVFLLLVLVSGAPPDAGPLLAVGSLPALALLVGVLRRRPLTALALTLLGATAVVVVPPRTTAASLTLSYQGQFLAYLAADLVLGYIVATCRRRVCVVAVTLAFGVQLTAIGLFAHGPEFLIVDGVVGLLAMAASCMLGLLSRERREHAVALRAQEVAEAVTAERLRIARELHDMIAHSVGIIAIQAGVGSRVIHTQPDAARDALRAIESTSRQTLSGLRRTLVALRQAEPDTATAERTPPAPSPGLADVERLAAATAEAGVRVEVRVSGERRPLPADVDLSAYRIVQEALTNVVRHAGTGYCTVAVDYGNEELSVEVVDDGCGAAGEGSGHGFGIVGMRERAALLHGRFSAGPRPEGGFRVAARLPLPEPVGVAVETR